MLNFCCLLNSIIWLLVSFLSSFTNWFCFFGSWHNDFYKNKNKIRPGYFLSLTKLTKISFLPKLEPVILVVQPVFRTELNAKLFGCFLAFICEVEYLISFGSDLMPFIPGLEKRVHQAMIMVNNMVMIML